MLVIENAADARARCAPHIYGEIIGQAATFDPRPGSGREPGLRRAMELALADAGLTAGDIDVLFADAAGVPELDRCEAAAISSVFGPAGVPVTAPKTMTGRLNGGGAALDLATALLSMRDGVIPPTMGVTDLAPDCAIDLVRAKPRQAEIRTAMVTARGYGGFNTAIVLKKPQLKEIKMPEFAVNSSFTLNDLREVMRTCAGIDESVDLDSDIGGRTFEDLGYDSLAVLEMTAKIQNMLGVVITDDAARELTTPQSLVDHVAAQLTGHQAAISQLCSRRLRRTSWQDTLTTRLSLTRPWTSSGK
ncbi:MAG TPA: phosphopantetheine-binding protein, partial [Streptosporangiaceae bacterium]|nr:phosphopantetheine-binding protein [Streptosporangiaceae bacterium]